MAPHTSEATRKPHDRKEVYEERALQDCAHCKLDELLLGWSPQKQLEHNRWPKEPEMVRLRGSRWSKEAPHVHFSPASTTGRVFSEGM